MSVLKQFAVTDAKTLAPLLGSSKLEELNPQALDIVFNSAVSLKRLANNTKLTKTVIDSKPVKTDPFAEHYAAYDNARK